MRVLLAQAVLAGLSRAQQNQPAGLCELLSVPAKLSVSECLRTGRADLVGSIRPSHCQQSEEGRICQDFGSLRPSTNSDKLSDQRCICDLLHPDATAQRMGLEGVVVLPWPSRILVLPREQSRAHITCGYCGVSTHGP